jgi:hypothetical protein
MERFTPEDQLMLWPDELWPQEIGCLSILECKTPLDPAGKVNIEDVDESIAARLQLVPRLPQLTTEDGARHQSRPFDRGEQGRAGEMWVVDRPHRNPRRGPSVHRSDHAKDSQ